MVPLIYKWLLPPAVARLWRKSLRKLRNAILDEAAKTQADSGLKLKEILTDDWSDFRRAVGLCNKYAEYGSGESTLFVAMETSADIRSIESDPDWVNRVTRSCPRPVQVLHVDIGPTGEWGRPLGYERADAFRDYCLAPFADGYSPELVLIDGRFRVACFATALLVAAPGTKLVIDDYVTRPNYFIVERLLKPDFMGSKQAFFTVPDRPRAEEAERIRDKFEFVMD